MALQRIKDLWRSLEPRGQLSIVGCVLLVLVTFFLLYTYAGQTSYSTLATGIDPAQTGQMTKALDSAGIPYRVQNGGTQISVPDTQSAQARIALAEKGLTGGGQVGFEIFNKVSMGATAFQQNIDYQRALEGEVDRAIQQIQGISSADVQLVLPQDTLFVDQSSNASAGVLLTSSGPLDASTVSGIAHLVAASVKGLDVSSVTITDQTGALLWPTSNTTGGVTASTKLAADQLYSSEVAASINAMLIATLGPGKAQARVHADLNVDQTTIAKTSYSKKGTPLQSQLTQESLKSSGGGPVVPAGATTNTTTPTYPAASTGNSKSNYTNKVDNTTFGVDKTVQKTTVAPGSVNRLDVALLVDSSVPKAEVASLKQSVASMAGIIPKRGDTLAVSTVAFAKPAASTTTTASPIGGILANPIAAAKYVLLGLATLVFLFMMRRGLKRRESEGVAPEPKWLTEITRAIPVAELEAGSSRPALDAAGERRAALKAEAEDIAQKQPEQLAVQVSAWLKE